MQFGDWYRYLQKRGLKEETILKAGLYYRRPWIHIPYNEVIDPSPIGIQKVVKGRFFDDGPKPLVGQPKYIWLKHSAQFPYLWDSLFAKDAEGKKVFICEGEFDALLLNQIMEVTGKFGLAISVPFGSMTFKDLWIGTLKEKNVVVCFDNDEAGVKGAQKIADKLNKKIERINWLPTFRKSGDVTDFYLEDTSIEKFKNLAVKEVIPVFKKDDSLVVKKEKFYLQDGTLEELKNKIPINAVLESFIKLRETSNGWQALCPFHNDKNPSFVVYRDSNSWYCFSCGKGGTSIDFLIHQLGISVFSAIQYLKNNYGSQYQISESETKREKIHRGDGGGYDPS